VERCALVLSLILLTGTWCFSATIQEIQVNEGHVAAYGISGNGLVVVGEVYEGEASFPFSWTKGGGILCPDNDLDYPLGPFAWAEGASYDGAIIVGFSKDYDENLVWRERAWRYIKETETFEYLGDLEGYEHTWAVKVSGNGTVITGIAVAGGRTLAFRWTKEDGYLVLPPLAGGDSNSCSPTGITKDGNVIVGNCWLNNGLQGFRWSAEEGTQPYDLPLGYNVTSISADGSTLIGYVSNGGEFNGRAFKYSGSGNVEYAPLLAGNSFAEPDNVSGNGSVIVGYIANEPFLWDSTGIRNLKDVLNMGGTWIHPWHHGHASVSEDGRIVAGSGYKTADAPYVSAWVADLGESGEGDSGGGDSGGGGGGCFISSILP
jgi:hypothetical protein